MLALSGYEGRWSGAVRPRDPACGPERHGLMRVGGGTFAFDPFQSTVLIDGQVEGDRLHGVLTRAGGDHRMLSISFEGRGRSTESGSEVIEGMLSSGKCTWDVALSRG